MFLAPDRKCLWRPPGRTLCLNHVARYLDANKMTVQIHARRAGIIFRPSFRPGHHKFGVMTKKEVQKLLTHIYSAKKLWRNQAVKPLPPPVKNPLLARNQLQPACTGAKPGKNTRRTNARARAKMARLLRVGFQVALDSRSPCGVPTAPACADATCQE